MSLTAHLAWEEPPVTLPLALGMLRPGWDCTEETVGRLLLTVLFPQEKRHRLGLFLPRPREGFPLSRTLSYREGLCPHLLAHHLRGEL